MNGARREESGAAGDIHSAGHNLGTPNDKRREITQAPTSLVRRPQHARLRFLLRLGRLGLEELLVDALGDDLVRRVVLDIAAARRGLVDAPLEFRQEEVESAAGEGG